MTCSSIVGRKPLPRDEGRPTRSRGLREVVCTGHRLALPLPVRPSWSIERGWWAHADELSVTVITVEEQLSGWYSLLRGARKPTDLVNVYCRLARNVRFLSRLRILEFSELASSICERLTRLRLGMGTLDLRIASTVLAHDGTLVTRNIRDFKPVPDLRIEDWS